MLYASRPKFKLDFEAAYLARRVELDDDTIRMQVTDLKNQGLQNATSITRQILTEVHDAVLHDLDGAQQGLRAATVDDEQHEQQVDQPKDEDEEEEQEEEDWWHQPCPASLCPNPPPSLRSALDKQRDAQFRLASLSSYPRVLEQVKSLLVDGNDEINTDFANKVWVAERTSKHITNDVDDQKAFRFLALRLTDFWSMCFQGTVRANHERTFWVERVVPFFKYVGSTPRIVFSWQFYEYQMAAHKNCQRIPGIWTNKTNIAYADGIGRIGDKEAIMMESSSGFDEEDIKHSLGDTYKLVDEIPSTLKMELRKKQQAKSTLVYDLAVYGNELKYQQRFERELLLQQNQIQPVTMEETLGFALKNLGIL
ncbi:hypothetical protein DFQ30_000107 [Apophysomyces sp. BC1015]|nr:hypothetical protein DFQ30_000107 [Apophysomyces sp. BC1015]